MHQPKFLFRVFILFTLLSACNTEQPEVQQKQIQDYVASADSISSSTDPAELDGAGRKVIRTADIKCRVDDVQHSVKQLEIFAQLAGGFVEESYTGSDIQTEKSSAYHGDSIKTAQVYRTSANMVIRIPYYALDTLAYRISELATFIHYRKMDRDDVTLQFIANALKNKEADKTAKLAESTTPSKNNNVVETLTYRDNNANRQIDRRVANLDMQDKSRYATLKLELYQPDRIAVIVMQDVDKAMAGTFGDKMIASLGYSAEILQGILLIIVTFWPLWLIGVLLFIAYNRFGRKKRPEKDIVPAT